ncbi:MAG: hypothetical protein GXY09_07945 [Bacteroidales bacterium]|nr:hypothetical protein [Bacteroidales bacterium]
MKTNDMKSKLITAILTMSSLMTWATTYDLNGTSGYCSVEDYYYNNEMNECWFINTNTYQKITIVYDVDTEEYCDYVYIYNVSDAGDETLLCELSGSEYGTITTTIPNGKAKIEFVSDGSICYVDGDEEYNGFFIEYSSSTFTFDDTFLTNGNATIAGNLGVGIVNPATKLHINGPIRGGGTGGALSVSTMFGSLLMGPTNTTYSSFSTDRSRFQFNKPLYLNDAKISSYYSDLSLQTNGLTKVTILRSNGNVGIGETQPFHKLHVHGSMYLRSDDYNSYSGSNTNHFYWYGHRMMMGTQPGDYAHNIFMLQPGGSDQGELVSSLQLWHAASTTSKDLRIHLVSSGNSYFNGGNIGIGTNNPQYLLDVNGIIRAMEIKVEPIGQFADFVFAEDYSLPTLKDVDDFIQTNGHLPNVPSASEVKEKGLNLVEMQIRLLQKIEELTLYTIEQQRLIESQQRRLEELEKAITK